MPYLRRTIDSNLDELLPHISAIAIDGPKGVGKTETAQRRVSTILRLDEPAQREILSADFDLSTLPEDSILFDEWQHLPQVWDSVRRKVDAGAPPGKYLLTGSATPSDPQGTHSGAGRILSLRMRPMGLHERGLAQQTISFKDLLGGNQSLAGTTNFALHDYAQAIIGSGFPGIMGKPPRAQRALLDAYLLRVIDRDLPDQGLHIRRPETLRRWLTAYAAATSTTTTYSRILDATTAGDGTQPAKTTTITYRDHLTQLWLLDPISGWTPSNSPIRRLQQAPKHHLADPALAARLLGLTAETLLTPAGAHMAGPLFEALVALTIRTLAQTHECRVSHMRTTNGDREIDLIVENDAGDVLGIEVKLAPHVTDKDVKHLHWLRDQIPDRIIDLAVITTGPTAYRRADGIAVIPLALIGE